MATPEQLQALAGLFYNQNAPPMGIPVMAVPGQQAAQTEQDEAARLMQQLSQPPVPEQLPVPAEQSNPMLRHLGAMLADAMGAYASARVGQPGLKTDFVGQLRSRREQRDTAIAENKRRMESSKVEGQRTLAGLQYQRLLGKEDLAAKAGEKASDREFDLSRDQARRSFDLDLASAREGAETERAKMADKRMRDIAAMQDETRQELDALRGQLGNNKLDSESRLAASETHSKIHKIAQRLRKGEITREDAREEYSMARDEAMEFLTPEQMDRVQQTFEKSLMPLLVEDQGTPEQSKIPATGGTFSNLGAKAAEAGKALSNLPSTLNEQFLQGGILRRRRTP